MNGMTMRRSITVPVLTLLCGCVFETDTKSIAAACAAECKNARTSAEEKAKEDQIRQTLMLLYGRAIGGYHIVLCADGSEKNDWTGAHCISVRAYP